MKLSNRNTIKVKRYDTNKSICNLHKSTLTGATRCKTLSKNHESIVDRTGREELQT